MAKNIQQLKPDIVVKNYWRDNSHFADFFNAALFEGKQVIRPEESSVLEHKDYAERCGYVYFI